jgi:predicted Zn finger-like uncharacterized protein
MSNDSTLTAQCPKCESVFRVLPQHLEAAKGWMQCGVCGNVFHTPLATAAKLPEPEPGKSEEPEAVETSTSDTLMPAETVSTEPLPAETVDQEVTENTEAPPQTATEPDASGPPTLTGLAQRMADQEPSVPFGPKLESIILVDPDIPVDDFGPLPTFEDIDESVTAPTTQTASGGYSSATESGWIPRQAAEAGTRTKKKTSWIWGVGAFLLAVAIAAQLIYFLRNDLAVQFPQLRPHLAKMCEMLDCRLTLPRDTRQVLILGSDLQTESQGNLALAVTLANRAKHTMAWPVLELTLTDIKDQAVGRRVFAPSEYLPSPELESAGMQPLSEVPLTLKLQTRGIKAVGYRLQMFY